MGRGHGTQRAQLSVTGMTDAAGRAAYTCVRVLRARLTAGASTAEGAASETMVTHLDLALALEALDAGRDTIDPESLAIVLLSARAQWEHIGAAVEHIDALDACLALLAPVAGGTRLATREREHVTLVATGRYRVCTLDDCGWSIETQPERDGAPEWVCLSEALTPAAP